MGSIQLQELVWKKVDYIGTEVVMVLSMVEPRAMMRMMETPQSQDTPTVMMGVVEMMIMKPSTVVLIETTKVIHKEVMRGMKDEVEEYIILMKDQVLQLVDYTRMQIEEVDYTRM